MNKNIFLYLATIVVAGAVLWMVLGADSSALKSSSGQDSLIVKKEQKISQQSAVKLVHIGGLDSNSIHNSTPKKAKKIEKKADSHNLGLFKDQSGDISVQIYAKNPEILGRKRGTEGVKLNIDGKSLIVSVPRCTIDDPENIELHIIKSKNGTKEKEVVVPANFLDELHDRSNNIVVNINTEDALNYDLVKMPRIAPPAPGR